MSVDRNIIKNMDRLILFLLVRECFIKEVMQNG